jgi:3-oxoacyl-[acyl-carrier protein] reductase
MKLKVLLTGASRGIGKAVFDELSSMQKYDIIAPKRSEMDLNCTESVDSFMANYKNVDIIINNAGINILSEIDNISDNSIEEMQRVNLSTPLKIIQCAVPHMKDNNFGRIINISSIWGVRSKEFRTLYSMTKFGINGMTRALARELGEYNILINSLCPGYVNTELTKQNVSLEEQQIITKTIPLRRFAEPYEVAKYIKFLISEENTYITGQSLIIDGGLLA